MAVLAPSPRVFCWELCRGGGVVREVVPSNGAAACSSVGIGGGGGLVGGLWSGEISRRKRRRRGDQVKAEAFSWSVSRPVEFEEIDGMEKFEEALRLSNENKQSIVIDWMANWCRKCIYLKPKLEKLAGEYPRIKFYFVDVNKVPQDLVKRGNISKMPTIQLWKDGEWKAEVIGGHKAWLVMDEVREMIQKHK